MIVLDSIDIPVWRILPENLAATPSIPARAPEGRFHHSSQIAAYASLSAEGAEVAIQRYLTDGNERILVPMRLNAATVVDQRGNTDASIVWQDLRASGEKSPTWQFSDAARQCGAEAMLYSSRSRPELSHVVVFDPSCLQLIGPVSTFKSGR